MLESTGSESTGGGSFNFVVGPVAGNNVMVNPTLKELNDYGVTWFKSPPEYSGKDREGNPQFMLDVWFKIVGFSYEDKVVEDNAEPRNVRFYLGTETRVSKAGNRQFVNQFGKFAWENSANWGKFDQTDMREALDGEEAICDWLRNYGNFKGTDKMQLDIAKLKKGDFSQIIEFAKKSPERKFVTILGASFNEDKNRYNSIVYPKQFWRGWMTMVNMPDGKGGWCDEPFATAIPKLMEDEYKAWPKSVFTPGIPMIVTPTELGKLANMPNNSEEINAEAGLEENDMPF